MAPTWKDAKTGIERWEKQQTRNVKHKADACASEEFDTKKKHVFKRRKPLKLTLVSVTLPQTEVGENGVWTQRVCALSSVGQFLCARPVAADKKLIEAYD